MIYYIQKSRHTLFIFEQHIINNSVNKIEPKIEASWKDILKDEFSKTYFCNLKSFLMEEKKYHVVYPKGKNIFNAFYHTPFNNVKVVIIGQDPYHGEGQAHGLAFSVSDEVKIPPSLKNIFKEIMEDCNIANPKTGNLTSWAKEGVLLLNSTLTVRAKQAGSHQKKGWEIFTDKIIKVLSDKKDNMVFILWGKFAQDKSRLIDTNKHYILKASHPSPFSAYNGFFGCKHFSKTNKFLKSIGKKQINWEI